MKARSRQAPVRSLAPRSLPPTIAVAPPLTPTASGPWDHWLDCLPAPRRQELFANPTLECVIAAVSPLRAAVQSLLANNVLDLPFAPSRIRLEGNLALPVARALQTPDLCLWNRRPTQDVSAPTADVVRHAVRLGLRVLVVAASPAPLERMLAKVAGDAAFLAVRFSAPGEHASNGPLTRFGLEDQRGALRGSLLVRAAQVRADLDASRARIDADAAVWESLDAVVRELTSLVARHNELSLRRANLAAEVRREADALTEDDRAVATGPFAAEFALVVKPHRERLDACDKSLVPLHDQRDSFDHSLGEMAREQERLTPLFASFRAGRWWTPSYWSARFNSMLRRHADSIAEQEQTIRVERDRIAATIAAIEAQRQSVLCARTVEVEALVSSEVGRRQTEIDRQMEILEQRQANVRSRWNLTRAQLAAADDRPTEATIANHVDAHTRWRGRIEKEMSSAGSPRNPQEMAADFLRHMPMLAPVVVGTTLALSRHPDFAAAAQIPFDLVILDDADRLAELDLLAILSRASRALVVGTSASSATSFAKMWRLLHRTDAPATYHWSRGGEGYVCTLRPLTDADKPFVEAERLADFPEIELRILSIPKQPPRLAQVVFPSRMSAVAAKSFIYRELQEAAVDRVDRPKQFLDTPERFTIVWDCPELPTEESVDLEPGLREAICAHGNLLTTCHIAFDKSAGWDQPKIDDWLRRHIPTLDAPRTADLS